MSVVRGQELLRPPPFQMPPAEAARASYLSNTAGTSPDTRPRRRIAYRSASDAAPAIHRGSMSRVVLICCLVSVGIAVVGRLIRSRFRMDD
jgi:hypothetical protein